MHLRFVARIEVGLLKLQAAAASGRLGDIGEALRRWGRLQAQSWRGSDALDVTIRTLTKPQGPARLAITWKPNQR